MGPKRSGKGTIARVMEAVVGTHNVTAQSMSDFTQNFGFVNFIGKTLATIADARLGKKKLAEIAEKILEITGENKIKINRKYKNPIEAVLQTKLFFLSNLPLNIPDESGVLPTRFIYVELTKSFFGKEDPDLADRLLTELPGILNLAIKNFRELLKRNAFIQPQAGEALYKRMRSLCSPVSAFAQELEPYTHPGIIWMRWSEFRKDEGEKPGKRKDFEKELEAAGYDLDAARILEKIKKLGGEVPAYKIRDCSRRFNDPKVRDKKLQEMVELELLNVRLGISEGNKKPTKFYSIKTDRPV